MGVIAVCWLGGCAYVLYRLSRMSSLDEATVGVVAVFAFAICLALDWHALVMGAIITVTDRTVSYQPGGWVSKWFVPARSVFGAKTLLIEEWQFEIHVTTHDTYEGQYTLCHVRARPQTPGGPDEQFRVRPELQGLEELRHLLNARLVKEEK